MAGIRPINGMGEAKPVRECEACDADTTGRAMKFVRDSQTGEGVWLCAPCFESLSWKR